MHYTEHKPEGPIGGVQLDEGPWQASVAGAWRRWSSHGRLRRERSETPGCPSMLTHRAPLRASAAAVAEHVQYDTHA